MLKLADNLKLPIDVVTQTVAMLAKRRAGKSYTMRRLVEQLVAASQQVVLVDPKGDQWGVRSSADGKGAGLPLVILGGERADVPLESGAGETVAKLVVEERVSAVLDLSLFRKHEVATFMTGFLENLYRLKAKEVYRTPMMLVIDEADAVAPQKPQKGEERMLGAAEDIVRRGGQRGIGCVLVTQRSAVLNKNVLTQAQILVALRTIAPQDLDALQAWIDVHGTEEERKTLMESLPSLPVGDAWFWSPGWPTVDGIFKRVHVLPIETFDSGATPKPGEKRREPKTVADIDLEALKRQMSTAIEKAKADDPRELRKQLAEANRMLANQAKAIGELQARQPAGREKRVEVPVLKDSQLDRAEVLVTRTLAAILVYEDRLKTMFETAKLKTDKPLTDLRAVVDSITAAIAQTRPVASAPRHTPAQTTAVPRGSGVRSDARTVRPAASSSNGSSGGLPQLQRAAERKILQALAPYADGRTIRQVAILAGYAMNGGGFRNAVGRLRSEHLVDSPAPGALRITELGLTVLGPYDPLPMGEALISHWLGQLGRKAEREILEVLVEAYPGSLTAEEIANRTATGYEANGGGFRNALGKLRTLELVQGRGELKASDEFFVEA